MMTMMDKARQFALPPLMSKDSNKQMSRVESRAERSHQTQALGQGHLVGTKELAGSSRMHRFPACLIEQNRGKIQSNSIKHSIGFGN